MDKDKLKQLWNERPLEVVAVGAAAVTAAAKLLDVVSASRSRKAYAKQVKYRINKK